MEVEVGGAATGQEAAGADDGKRKRKRLSSESRGQREKSKKTEKKKRRKGASSFSSSPALALLYFPLFPPPLFEWGGGALLFKHNTHARTRAPTPTHTHRCFHIGLNTATITLAHVALPTHYPAQYHCTLQPAGGNCQPLPTQRTQLCQSWEACATTKSICLILLRSRLSGGSTENRPQQKRQVTPPTLSWR